MTKIVDRYLNFLPSHLPRVISNFSQKFGIPFGFHSQHLCLCCEQRSPAPPSQYQPGGAISLSLRLIFFFSLVVKKWNGTSTYSSCSHVMLVMLHGLKINTNRYVHLVPLVSAPDCCCPLLYLFTSSTSLPCACSRQAWPRFF